MHIINYYNFSNERLVSLTFNLIRMETCLVESLAEHGWMVRGAGPNRLEPHPPSGTSAEVLHLTLALVSLVRSGNEDVIPLEARSHGERHGAPSTAWHETEVVRF